MEKGGDFALARITPGKFLFSAPPPKRIRSPWSYHKPACQLAGQRGAGCFRNWAPNVRRCSQFAEQVVVP